MAYTDKTKAAIKTEVRHLINEEVAMFITDTDLEAWIDRGINHIARITMYDENHGTDSLASGVTAYAITDTNADNDQIQIANVLYLGAVNDGDNAQSLTKTHPRQTSHNIKAGEDGVPSEWWVADNKIHVWPPPSGNENNHIIDIYYIDYPDTYVEANVPPYLQEYTILYTLSKAYEKMERFAAAEQYMSDTTLTSARAANNSLRVFAAGCAWSSLAISI